MRHIRAAFVYSIFNRMSAHMSTNGTRRSPVASWVIRNYLNTLWNKYSPIFTCTTEGSWHTMYLCKIFVQIVALIQCKMCCVRVDEGGLAYRGTCASDMTDYFNKYWVYWPYICYRMCIADYQISGIEIRQIDLNFYGIVENQAFL